MVVVVVVGDVEVANDGERYGFHRGCQAIVMSLSLSAASTAENRLVASLVVRDVLNAQPQ